MKRETHSDARGRYGYGYAYNVKVHRALPSVAGESEDLRGQAYESAQRDWWVEAELLAKSLGFSGVASAGRSGGYIVPLWNDQPVGPDLFGYYGDGEHGQEFDAAMETRLQAFEAGIADLMGQVPARFVSELEWLVEQEAEEAAEAAAESQSRADTFAAAVASLRASGYADTAAALQRYA